MALLERGVKARSYTGGQVSIHTDSSHTKARIRKIDEGRMRADLAEGRLVVVAVFRASMPRAMSLRSAAADRTPLRCARRRPEGRRVPDLHGRRRRLHHRSPHRAGRSARRHTVIFAFVAVEGYSTEMTGVFHLCVFSNVISVPSPCSWKLEQDAQGHPVLPANPPERIMQDP